MCMIAILTIGVHTAPITGLDTLKPFSSKVVCVKRLEETGVVATALTLLPLV